MVVANSLKYLPLNDESLLGCLGGGGGSFPRKFRFLNLGTLRSLLRPSLSQNTSFQSYREWLSGNMGVQGARLTLTAQDSCRFDIVPRVSPKES